MHADDVAAKAAQRAGVAVRSLNTLPDVRAMAALFDEVWRPGAGNSMVAVEQAWAMAYTGNYVAGAFAGSRMVGACLGFFTAPPGFGLHSDIAAVGAGMRGRGVGLSLKLHQRAWARDRGLTEVTWTFDPLVRRNARFNLRKLGALPRDYLVDFYGDIDDEVNAGQGSDRLLVVWHIDRPAPAELGAAPDMDRLRAEGAVVALREDANGEPAPAPAVTCRQAARLLVQVPADIDALRRSDPGIATRWRLAMREVLAPLLSGGASVTGFTESGYYLVEGTTP